jgi:ATP-binding cassette subfamily F protein uup
VATSVIVSEGDGLWREYAGGYSDMLAQRGEGVTARKVDKSAPAKKEKASTPEASPQKPQAKSKLSFTQQHLLKTLPETIEKLEARLESLQAEMNDPQLYVKNPDKFAKISQQITDLTAEKDAAEEQWLELEMLNEAG